MIIRRSETDVQAGLEDLTLEELQRVAREDLCILDNDPLPGYEEAFRAYLMLLCKTFMVTWDKATFALTLEEIEDRDESAKDEQSDRARKAVEG